MLAILLAIPTVIIALITYRFYRLSGARFELTSIDPLTFIYFLQLIMASVGSYIIAANLIDNDWINYLAPTEAVRFIGWGVVQYGFLGCSIGIFLGLKIFDRQHSRLNFLDNLSSKDVPKASHAVIWIFLFCLCFASGLHVYLSIGSFPIFSAFSSIGEALAIIRSDTKLGFPGVVFIRDFGFVALGQILAYYSYSLKLRYRKSIGPRILYWISLVIAFLALTLNLEKGPIVIFFFSLLVIRFFHGHRSSPMAQGLVFFLIGSLLVGTYLVTFGTDLPVEYFVEEIMGRIFIAQVAGVFMTLSIFPSEYDFVFFSGIGVLSDAFGGSQSAGSPRMVMEHFRPTEVAAGLLGYKSSYFVAEAYGNFGIIGMLLSPFIVGAITSLYFAILKKFKNQNLAIAGITYITFNLPYTSNFASFYYNPGLWILLLILLVAGNLIMTIRLKGHSNL
ncbi:MAG: hypothetical protein CMC84_07685 [Flavobacteriaceae bacterium]|nr:hypothetical protein [Flavobacteriaceae bacterium]|tara:strand:- start:1336 stop:2679 length:1344 start_codon:yes stop_codon:yes gene_type:complete